MQNVIVEQENNIIKIKVQQVRNKKITKIDNIPEDKKQDLKNIILQGDMTHTNLIQLLKESCENCKIEINGKIC
ncbi:hypothetical protein NAPIS_ORF01248 [Vairimorpha apis BRL 01]|uniref:Uncharacterized protein n=1 Tax=Vairimorpha apis BRL 01 TaxID=1037528 RepID=T0L9J8_9MICR|nr:hypothetical protein NAPIS_ORF01248 [Vairimorpha apis BRL 01]